MDVEAHTELPVFQHRERKLICCVFFPFYVVAVVVIVHSEVLIQKISGQACQSPCSLASQYPPL